MKIPGGLASTIKVLAGLGSLEKRVLKSTESKIDNDKEHPSHLRARIFEEIRTVSERSTLCHCWSKRFLMLSIVPSIGKFIEDFRINKKEL